MGNAINHAIIHPPSNEDQAFFSGIVQTYIAKNPENDFHQHRFVDHHHEELRPGNPAAMSILYTDYRN